ncbi:MAG TPA: EAL domain-containing protein [Rhodocyclaceae bacterium]|nr:EAL domain-containing protein [Rhodocyclaceae bacterium]
MTSALTDLVRYLNTRTDQLAPNTQLKHPFVATETGALVHFAGLRLQSRYLPIIETLSGQLYGHAASLWAQGLSSRQPLDPATVFVLPTDDNEFVYLDRLLRTLHALNYLTQKSRGNLLLRVHQRHVMTVPANHGLAFEELLRPVGLIPAQITLEIDPNGVGDKNRLIAAILGYQSRGYGIALSHFGRSPLDFDIVEAVSPSLVKIDPLLFASTRPLRRIVSKLHGLGARILADGISTGALRRAAQENGIDLFQAPTAFPDICTPPFAAANDAVGVQARTRLP